MYESLFRLCFHFLDKQKETAKQLVLNSSKSKYISCFEDRGESRCWTVMLLKAEATVTEVVKIHWIIFALSFVNTNII